MSEIAASGLALRPARDLASGTERPLLTYCDDATGERTEFTSAALGSWAARTAALLRDGCGIQAGDRAAVLLPPHWQTAAVLFGAWAAGVAVTYRPWATAGLPLIENGEPQVDESLATLFVSQTRLDSWLEVVPEARHRFVLGLAPHGAPLDRVPTGYRDYVAELRHYPDTSPAYQSIRPTDPASPDGTSYQQWAEVARSIATSRGIQQGDRVLVNTAEHEQPVEWLLAPMTAGASIVLCANMDRDTSAARIAAEGITRVL